QRPPEVSGRPMTPEERKVIFASSLGTVFEWYDFYIFGTLAAIVGKQFFLPLSPTAQFIMTLLAFAAGFAVRPFGAIIFGRIGDIVGRKYTFLITITIMGTSTFLIGLLPSYASWGVAAPVILISLRLLQGLALGGEYGGAATYVAEHAPQGRRGAYTSWIQTTATVGLFMALLVILGARSWVGEDAFANAGWWRLPFLLSFFLLIISVWIRLSLAESPAFARMKQAGRTTKAPLTESFGRMSNLRIVVLALLGGTAGQAVVWYTGQFYALFFLTQSLKVDGSTANLMIAASLLIGTPFFIVFGALSDRIGRKKIIMAGCLLAVLTYFPLFHGLTHYANPALEAAHATAPAVVVADPDKCSVQFNPVGTAKFTTPCDLAKSTLAGAAVLYSNEAAPPGSTAVVKFGDKTISFADIAAAQPETAKQAGDFKKALTDAIKAAGYPAKADAAQINKPMVVLILTILVVYVTMVYGPIAAWLVELFPTRIRYTSMSLPYHIGNGWFGGFLPATSFAIVAATGNIYSGLWYPIIVAGMTFVIGTLFLPETKDRDIYAGD
ncbi:MAG TPA: MFS transporter, partial [Burkholderiaceae bacterium]